MGSIPMILDEYHSDYLMGGVYTDYLEDPTNSLTIDEIINPFYQKKFINDKDKTSLTNDNVNSTFWIKTTIRNNCYEKTHFAVELYDFKIDYYELYIPYENGFKTWIGGGKIPFDEKVYPHKNFINNLIIPIGGEKTIYYKIKSDRPISMVGKIRTHEKLLAYATSEYFFLAIFYGVVASMALFNVFLFLSTRHVPYLFYILYLLTVGFFGLTLDGLGFEFLWPSHPEWNVFIQQVATYLMVASALLYARSFLRTWESAPKLDTGLLIVLMVRTVIFCIAMYYPLFFQNQSIDIIPLFYCYLVGILLWKKGNRTARFYVLAFTMLFLGFSITALDKAHYIDPKYMAVYGYNAGVLCEMILLSLALADRIKMLTIEKQEVQQKMIHHLQEKESRKDDITKELEHKVFLRTKDLEHKNKELDTFLYRTSHDLKGPIKSLLGVAKLGIMEVEEKKAKDYFDHFIKTSEKLDSVVDHLTDVMNIKESNLCATYIDFNAMVKNILLKLEETLTSKNIRIMVSVHDHHPFSGDEVLIYSIIENIIQNSIRFTDPLKTNPYIKIIIQTYDTEAKVRISDNGMGIEKHLQDKIFDMFYEINPESMETGVGLYKIKLCVEKLNGQLKFKSDIGSGTTFSFKIKNMANQA